MRRIRGSLPVKSGVAFGLIVFTYLFAASPTLLQPFQLAINSVGLSPAKPNISSQYWYGGACSNDTRALENSGARTVIDVVPQNVSDFLAFWVSESFSNNLWAQVGYYIYQSSVPVGFYQIWNLTTRTEVSSATSTLEQGLHAFSFIQSNGILSFQIDGATFATYNLGQVTSGDSYPICALSEEGFAPAPFTFTPVAFKVAIQVMKSGNWSPASSATSFGDSWGIQGHSQNSSLDTNQIVVGGDLSILPTTSLLWS